MTRPIRARWILFLSLVFTGSGPVRAGFTITDLGISGTKLATVATAISDSGATAGQVSGPSGTSALDGPPGKALAYVDTGNLPGITPIGFGSSYSVASGVNAGGNVVGTYLDYNDHGAQRYHAFATINGKAVDFGTLTGTALDGASTKGVAIDSNGTILGTAYLGGTSTAFRSSSPGSVAAIALPPGGSNGIAAGMNASGAAVGNYTSSQGASRVFVSSSSGGTFDLLNNNPTRGFGLNLYASGIADNGDVAGYGDFNGQSHAFLATGNGSGGVGQFTDIGTLSGFNSSKSLGLNASGQVVGEMDASGYNSHAFLYSQTLGLCDLNSLLTPIDAQLWTLSVATGINNGGQIVGQGLINGQLHGFLLTPTNGGLTVSLGSVPTPPSMVLALAGLSLLGGWSLFRSAQTAARGIV